MQEELMSFDPETGEPRPFPQHAEQWRQLRGKAAWLYTDGAARENSRNEWVQHCAAFRAGRWRARC